MNETLTIELPVRVHLKKFILQEYGIRLSMKDPLGILIWNMLYKRSGDRPDRETLQRYPDKLLFDVPVVYFERKYIGPHLDKSALVHLDVVLDGLFKKELVKQVRRFTDEGMERQLAIEKFCDMYQILENDISFDALKKAEYRARQDELKQKQAA